MHAAGLGAAFCLSGLGAAFCLSDRIMLSPAQRQGHRQCTPAKHALPKPGSLAALRLAEQTHGRRKRSCRCLWAAQHQAMHRSRGEGRGHPACPRPSALQCIFSLTCNTVLLSQTMSVFDQFLYPRHCRAHRPKRPDGSCCRSLPALPHPFPNSLQIPGMPAPPKTSPGQRQASALGTGAGGSPGHPSSPLAAPPQQAAAPDCRLLHRVAREHFPPKTRDPWVCSAEGGMCRPQNPQPSPKEPASSRVTASREDSCP